MNLNDVIKDVKLSKQCSIKVDKESDVSKKINVVIDFDGATLRNVFDKAVSGAVIQWQNGPGRTKFDEWKDNQTVNIKFQSPGARSQVDPETAMIQKLQAMTPKEQLEYLNNLAKKAQK